MCLSLSPRVSLPLLTLSHTWNTREILHKISVELPKKHGPHPPANTSDRNRELWSVHTILHTSATFGRQSICLLGEVTFPEPQNTWIAREILHKISVDLPNKHGAGSLLALSMRTMSLCSHTLCPSAQYSPCPRSTVLALSTHTLSTLSLCSHTLPAHTLSTNTISLPTLLPKKHGTHTPAHHLTLRATY